MAAMNLEECLPVELRGSATTITPIGAGLSRAGVYRVEAAGRLFVLKVGSAEEPLEGWRRVLEIRQAAAAAALAPAIVHVDEGLRAVVSDFVLDRSFPALYRQPEKHAEALALLGRTLRAVHALPVPAGTRTSDARQVLADTWREVRDGFALPDFVDGTVERLLTAEAPPRERALVLSHNDVNPTNLIYDGERLLFLDWEMAGANDPFYDLATIAVFLRMDEGACRQLLAAHEGEPVETLPAGFVYNRRLAAALCGVTFLKLALAGGHPGADGSETLASVLSLSDVYQRLTAGTLRVASPEGQWAFGLAMVKASAE
jgi:aminoglycoside phosphotransferase (APT) family kinase protein